MQNLPYKLNKNLLRYHFKIEIIVIWNVGENDYFDFNEKIQCTPIKAK